MSDIAYIERIEYRLGQIWMPDGEWHPADTNSMRVQARCVHDVEVTGVIPLSVLFTSDEDTWGEYGRLIRFGLDMLDCSGHEDSARDLGGAL